jgi:hypothetical protein
MSGMLCVHENATVPYELEQTDASFSDRWRPRATLWATWLGTYVVN